MCVKDDTLDDKIQNDLPPPKENEKEDALGVILQDIEAFMEINADRLKEDMPW